MGRNGASRKKSDKGEYGTKEYGEKKCRKKEYGKMMTRGVGGNMRRRKYMAGAFALMSVIIIAFFTPQIIFRIQDSVLNQRTELSQRESMDVEALSSGYEKSLYQRMLSFAEGLALGDSFYVTSKNLAPDQEGEALEEYLYSGYLYRGMVDHVLSWDLIPLYAIEYEYTVNQWKQYVVYSDNYTKGVNFILWYIELAYRDNTIIKVLADAETGTLYALKSQGCQWKRPFDYVEIKYKEFFDPGNLTELWLLCASQFEAISSDMDLQELISGQRVTESDIKRQEIDALLIEEKIVEAERDIYKMAGIVSDMPFSLDEDSYAAMAAYIEERTEYDWEKRLVRLRLPYRAASLEISMEVGEWEPDEQGLSYAYPDITIGVRQLYEMIPEFM